LARLTYGDTGTRIYVRADQSIRYGHLMGVMDLLRQASYRKVALVGRAGGTSSRLLEQHPPGGAR